MEHRNDVTITKVELTKNLHLAFLCMKSIILSFIPFLPHYSLSEILMLYTPKCIL